jgi:dipeptidyl aminopeptidase/acylaminoacyl peptidase
MSLASSRLAVAGFSALVALAPAIAQQPATASRSMTFLDMQHLRQIGNTEVSPDGRWLLYTLSIPDWKNARRQTDVYLVSTEQAIASTRQLTFTKDKNETTMRWARDGSFFVFASNRDAPTSGGGQGQAAGGGQGGGGSGAGGATQNQLYAMRPDGGEARKVTDARDGVSTFAFSRDGRWLVYRSGKTDEEQLYALPVARVDSATPVQLTKHPTGVGLWQWAPDSKRIYFVTGDTVDRDEKLRTERRFNVAIRNMETPISSLWVLDVDSKQTRRLTRDSSITVGDFTISDDGRWVGFRGTSADRYKRNITEQFINSDLYLLETATGHIERLTNNREVSEGQLSFSPDGQWIAFSANDDLTQYSMKNGRVYVRRVVDRGAQFRKLGSAFDGDVGIGFWSRDGRTIYFNEGVRATNQVMAVDVATGAVRQVTRERASIFANQDDDSKRILITYADPRTPPTVFTVASVDQLPTRSAWRQLTDANPQTRAFQLGEEEEITWRSTDGKTVGGVLVKPVGYQPGRRYPLIVAIHGGPASADVLGFNGGPTIAARPTMERSTKPTSSPTISRRASKTS